MSYTPPAYTDAGGSITTGYTPPAYTDVGGSIWVFPVQFAGLRYFLGAVKELCLVALGDAPAGNQWRVRKGGTTYAVFLVDPSDPNASDVRVKTSAGIRAARLKT